MNGKAEQGLVPFAESGTAPNQEGLQVVSGDLANVVVEGAWSAAPSWQAVCNRVNTALTRALKRKA